MTGKTVSTERRALRERPIGLWLVVVMNVVLVLPAPGLFAWSYLYPQDGYHPGSSIVRVGLALLVSRCSFVRGFAGQISRIEMFFDSFSCSLWVWRPISYTRLRVLASVLVGSRRLADCDYWYFLGGLPALFAS